MRRTVLVLCAVIALALAAGLAAVGHDVRSWPGTLDSSDTRYRSSPNDTDLWRPRELAPWRVSRAVLGLDDDLAYRRAVQGLRLGRLEGPGVTDPNLSVLRSDAQTRLVQIATADGEPSRRSDAANLAGVLALVSLVAEEQDRAILLGSAIRSFRRAIALDPANEDAKYNLELSLQRGRELQLSEAAGGKDPAPGGRGSRGAGTGDPGSGY